MKIIISKLQSPKNKQAAISVKKTVDASDYIGVIFCVIALVVFFGCWGYVIVSCGFFMGILFGWIPSLVNACMAGAVIGIVLGLFLSVWGRVLEGWLT